MSFSEQFIQIMNEVGNKIGVTIDWTSQNVMPYLNDLLSRFIKYETLTSAAWILFLVLLLITAVFSFRFLIKNYKNLEYTGIDIAIPSLCILAVLVCLIMIPSEVFDIIEVNTIPEKTIIEYIQLQLK